MDSGLDSGDAGALARMAAGGDEAAWAQLVRRFSGLVWSVTRGCGLSTADAEDVFQTTWLRLTEHIGRLNDPDRVGAWLATTARRESIKIINARRRVSLTDDLDTLDGSDGEAPDAVLVDSEDRAAEHARLRTMWSAYQQLPVRCRELLRVLFASPPLSYTEIADLFGIAVGSIGPTRGRCLRQVRELLGDAATDLRQVPHA